MKRKYVPFFILFVCIYALQAQTPQKDISRNPILSSGNYLVYPSQNLPNLTPAPKGYVPFYINHYGRHGSRWMTQIYNYENPINELSIAKRNGKLTVRGQDLLSKLLIVYQAAMNRSGELTDIGAKQHKAIATRMFKNYPQVFAGNAYIEARSTIIIRSILSMENELLELQALNPKLSITHDASAADMWYMNYNDRGPIEAIREAKTVQDSINEFRDHKIHTKRFISQLINDEKFANDSIDCMDLMCSVFDIANSMQGHHLNLSFFDLFSNDERYNLWQVGNAKWYVKYGYSPITKSLVPSLEINLLKNMIESADKAIISGKNGATLRFGHDTSLYPLVCLLELNDYGRVINNLCDIADYFQDYKIIPMASNIQMIFYRNKTKKDIIVKILLNEHEMSLPLSSDIKPYYYWENVKDFYEKKLNNGHEDGN